jgi:hypothetical protein
MKPYTKRKFVEISLRRLRASKNANPKYSFLIKTLGSFSVAWHLWPPENEYGGFGTILNVLWSFKKIDQMKRLNSPTDAEIREWQIAVSKASLKLNTEHVLKAWIIPIWIDEVIKSYALFIDTKEPDFEGFLEPNLEGVFENPNKCISYMKKFGEVSSCK